MASAGRRGIAPGRPLLLSLHRARYCVRDFTIQAHVGPNVQNERISCSFFFSNSSTLAMSRSVVFWT
jgi:hypothetical protein